MSNAQQVGSSLETLGPRLEKLSIKLGGVGVVLSLAHWLSSLDLSNGAHVLRILLMALSASLGWVITTIAGVVAARLLAGIGTILVTLDEIARRSQR